MSSPESTGNEYRTPESSPEVTEADLRQLEISLDAFRNSLDDVVQHFDRHFDNYSSLDDTILQQLAEANTRTTNNETQVSDTNTQTPQVLTPAEWSPV